MQRTCAEGVAGLLAHVAQADGDAVASARLQALQQVLHRVALIGHLVVSLHLADHIAHVDGVCLKEDSERGARQGKKLLTTTHGRASLVFNHHVYPICSSLCLLKKVKNEVCFCLIQSFISFPDAVSYQRGVGGVVGRLPLQHGLRLLCAHTVEVSGRQPLVGNHFHHGEVRGRTQVGRDDTHLEPERAIQKGFGPT